MHAEYDPNLPPAASQVAVRFGNPQPFVEAAGEAGLVDVNTRELQVGVRVGVVCGGGLGVGGGGGWGGGVCVCVWGGGGGGVGGPATQARQIRAHAVQGVAPWQPRTCGGGGQGCGAYGRADA